MGHWPPTNAETLLHIADASNPDDFVLHSDGTGIDIRYGAVPGKGMFVCDPQYLAPLETEGLTERVEFSGKSWSGTTSRLTDKGREAVAMLRRARDSSSFKMPDWLLAELTQ
jgi:hypothetical protein